MESTKVPPPPKPQSSLWTPLPSLSLPEGILAEEGPTKMPTNEGGREGEMRAIIHHRRRSSVLPQAIRGRSLAVAAVRWMMLGWLDGWVGRSSATREIDISHGQKSARNHVTNGRANESLRGGRGDGRQEEDTQDEWSTRSHYRLVGSTGQNCPIISWVDWRSRSDGSPFSKKMDSHL